MARTKIVHLNIGAGSKQPRQPIHCEVLRSKRKTLALYIKQQKVVVRCPWGASNAEVDEFIENNHAWIQERLLEELQLERETLKIEKGGKIFYRARELTIVFKEGRKQRILINGDKFIIQGYKLNAAKARVQVEDYLIDKASEYIIPRARGLAKYLGVDRKIKEIKLRKTKSKWGHCTSQGILQYNWLIMLAPYSIIDYMITHEVCHMIHMDHSRQYWNLVGSICPDYVHYIDWLKAHEHRFWFD
ncbi:MAG: SprT family zinc-dependent metalloprotease [Gammaproteobacteria bacterium]|nr:SprT family zinc-dependent metalloprotease [Gammaproteobacteria bacterium]MDD9897237.1 SprT family zinc-dependent metalloprotease [Gammaproteobacteria bacterium]MDD9959178.1 SprT family zinc-dependent metalloprotease [Gammaproteobacteria bacterium]